MKTALIIHGTCDREEYFSDKYPSLSNSHWLPWIQKQLLMAGYDTQTPEMPSAFLPKYADWKRMFERFSVGEHSILIGHSCGGGFLVRWLSENPIKVARLVLVAPWLDPDKEKDPDFFSFEIDKKLSSRTDVHILASDNDAPDIDASIKKIREALIEAHVHMFSGMGHFCHANMGTEVFPELRAIVMGECSSVI